MLINIKEMRYRLIAFVDGIGYKNHKSDNKSYFESNGHIYMDKDEDLDKVKEEIKKDFESKEDVNKEVKDNITDINELKEKIKDEVKEEILKEKIKDENNIFSNTIKNEKNKNDEAVDIKDDAISEDKKVIEILNHKIKNNMSANKFETGPFVSINQNPVKMVNKYNTVIDILKTGVYTVYKLDIFNDIYETIKRINDDNGYSIISFLRLKSDKDKYMILDVLKDIFDGVSIKDEIMARVKFLLFRRTFTLNTSFNDGIKIKNEDIAIILFNIKYIVETYCDENVKYMVNYNITDLYDLLTNNNPDSMKFIKYKSFVNAIMTNRMFDRTKVRVEKMISPFSRMSHGEALKIVVDELHVYLLSPLDDNNIHLAYYPMDIFNTGRPRDIIMYDEMYRGTFKFNETFKSSITRVLMRNIPSSFMLNQLNGYDNSSRIIFYNAETLAMQKRELANNL